jgi:hypothetical protein
MKIAILKPFKVRFRRSNIHFLFISLGYIRIWI